MRSTQVALSGYAGEFFIKKVASLEYNVAQSYAK